MYTNRVNVQPYAIVKTNTLCSFNATVMQVELSVKAVIAVSLYDENGNYFSSQTIVMEGDDYIAWGSDDSYVNRYIATQLGTTLA